MELYELRFEIDEADEEAYEAVEEVFDIVVATHGKTVYLTAELDDCTSAISAARKAILVLTAAGIRIRRLCEDLVTRADIAERTGMTRQAVGQWIRGERRAADGQAFPEPYYPVAGGVWLWGEVNAWLQRTGINCEDDTAYPDRCDYAVVNAEMLDRRAADFTYSFVTHFPKRDVVKAKWSARLLGHGLSGDNAWTTSPLRVSQKQ